ncbi:MAG: alpha/beta hydrolase [Nitrosopumilus sp.]|nr:alpha/beta hydrolase [Nitrosopumilus sp.]
MNSNFSTYSIPTSQGNISIWDSQGIGKPVLFIHGNSACKESFSKQFETNLPQQYRFIAIDLPGHGNSDKAKDRENTYTISGYADVAIEVIKSLALDKPVVVGWSLGGHIGLNMLQKAQKLAGLLITGTPPIKISSEGFQEGFLPLPLFQTLFKKIEFSRSEANEFMSGGGFDTQKYPFIVDAALKTDGYARHHLVESMSKGVGGNQKEIVEIDDTPLCVVQGKNDLGINNKYITENVNYKNLFNKKVYIIDHSGHAVFWEKPEEFNDILSLFLSKILTEDGMHSKALSQGCTKKICC